MGTRRDRENLKETVVFLLLVQPPEGGIVGRLVSGQPEDTEEKDEEEWADLNTASSLSLSHLRARASGPVGIARSSMPIWRRPSPRPNATAEQTQDSDCAGIVGSPAKSFPTLSR